MSSGALVDVQAETKALERIIARWRQEGGDLTDSMAIVSEMLVAAVNDQFETSGGGKWAPLAPSTLRSRRGSSAQILVDTGAFAGSIAGDFGPDWAEASTGVSYAVYHVSDAPREHLPLRNPFDVPEDVLDEALMIIVNDMMSKFAQAGSGAGA